MPLTGKTVDALELGRSLSFFKEKSISKVEKLAGDASSRLYYRVWTESKGTYILQVSESFSQESSHSFLCGQRILSSIGVPVPEVIQVNAAAGWILLSDLGDETLQLHPELAFYRSAIDLILQWSIDARSDQQKIDASLRQSAPHFKWSFDEEKLQFEMTFTQEHLLRKLLKRDDSFAEWASYNSKFLASRPRVFCHRDFHSRNLMVQKQKLFVIDFQDARMGPCTYDLVSLLWDPYVQLSQQWKADLFEYWLKSAQKLKITGTLDPNFPEELERMKVQRLLKAAGSYASFFNVKGRTDYLPYILPALEESENSLRALDRMKKLHQDDEKILTLVQALRTEIPAILEA